MKRLVSALVLLAACGVQDRAAFLSGHWQEAQVLAVGPAWAVDVARYKAGAQQAAGMPTGARAVYVPGETHWLTIILRSGEDLYVCREKAQDDDADVTAGETVMFRVHGNRVKWHGGRHTAYLVQQ